MHVKDASEQDLKAGVGKRGQYEVGRVEQLSNI